MKQVDSSRFGPPDALRERAAALARYEVWDREHPVELDPAAAVALVSSLYDLLPIKARTREDDPEFSGVAEMRRALARLRGSGD